MTTSAPEIMTALMRYRPPEGVGYSFEIWPEPAAIVVHLVVENEKASIWVGNDLGFGTIAKIDAGAYALLLRSKAEPAACRGSDGDFDVQDRKDQ